MVLVPIRICAGVEYNNKVFFSSFFENGLYVMDLSTKKINYIKEFDEDKISYALYSSAVIFENEAWFIPHQAKRIAIVNLDTLCIEYLSLEDKVENKNAKEKYNLKYNLGSKIDNETIFLIPCNYTSVPIINMRQRTVDYIDNVVQNDKEIFLEGAFDEKHNLIWLVPHQGKMLVSINICTKEINRIAIDDKSESYFGIECFNSEVFLLNDSNESLLIYNTENKSFEKINMCKYIEKNQLYYVSYIKDNMLNIVPLVGDRVITMNLCNRELATVEVRTKLDDAIRLNRIYSDNMQLFTQYVNNRMYILDKDSNEVVTIITECEFYINDNPKDLSKYYRIMGLSGIVNESSMELQDYLKYVRDNNEDM